MTAFDELVLLAYDAPLREEGWSPFLQAIMAQTSSRAALLKWLSLDTGRWTLVGVGLEPAILRAYTEHYAAVDVWSKVPVGPGDNVFGEEMLNRAMLERSEFYSDFCRPNAIDDIHKTVIARGADNIQVSLGLLKSARVPERRRDRHLTRRLAPHLQRSLAIAAHRAAIEGARGALAEALDHAGAAVFFLDERGRVRFCTRAAERIAADGDGLSIVAREIRADRPSDERALSLQIAGARVWDETEPAPVLVARRSGRAPFRVLAVPVHRRHEDLAGRGVVTMVFVDDAETAPNPLSEEMLRRLYGLTVAEARVAVRIGRGASPREIAQELGTSWHTVRAQLREVFAKTGTRRQSALVNLLAGRAPLGEER